VRRYIKDALYIVPAYLREKGLRQHKHGHPKPHDS